VLPFLFLLQAATEDPPPPPPPKPVEQLHQIVVDAIRNCAKPTEGEIVVCSKDRGVAEGYRIPKMDDRFAKNLRPSGRGELAGAAVGATGIGSCSKVGPGGSIGCTRNELKAWGAEQKAKRDAQRAKPPE
jgi:hypothetical protein